ncbi:MAG TPA: TauD/TfdA family dioxygenase [Gammaproteobacteria bacterium]
MSAAVKHELINLVPLRPFGILVAAAREAMTMHDIPVNLISGLLAQHKLVLFRGYGLLEDGDYLAFARQFGPLLQWEFGEILELKVRTDPANHIFTAGRVELHWDGAFVEDKPHYNVFQCLQGCSAGAGGETLFVDTTKVLAEADSRTLTEWRNITIEYVTEKKAHYGGTLRSPLIAVNPYSGRNVVRYIEAFNEDNADINPMRVSVENYSEKMSEHFLRGFTARLYRDDVMYRHIWQGGDFLIADNATLLHGRSRFNTADVGRHIKRINIL